MNVNNTIHKVDECNNAMHRFEYLVNIRDLAGYPVPCRASSCLSSCFTMFIFIMISFMLYDSILMWASYSCLFNLVLSQYQDHGQKVSI